MIAPSGMCFPRLQTGHDWFTADDPALAQHIRKPTS